MRIQCPDAAEQLLDLAIDAAAANKRIIFSCHCLSPDNAEYCHRSKVAKLVSHSARRRRVRVEIEEWPGGAPARTTVSRIRIGEPEMRKVRHGASTVSLTKRQASTALAAMPWGALVELVSLGEQQVVSAGPLQYRARHWQLPVFLFPVEEGDSAERLMPSVRRLSVQVETGPLRS